MSLRIAVAGALLALAVASGPVYGQARKGKPAPAPVASAPQKIGEEYTRLIKEYRAWLKRELAHEAGDAG